MNRVGGQRGVALLAVLGIVLALLPLTAVICLHTQLDGLMQRNAFGSSQAFYAAEAGLAHAVAEIVPTTSLATLLLGADGLEGTADDGDFAFRSPPPPELDYQVRVTVDDDSIRLRSTGQGLHGARHDLEMIVAPSATPFTPGALYIEAAAVALELGGGEILLSGVPVGEGSGGAAAVAGIAVTSSATADALRSTLPPAQVAGSGGAPSIAATTALDLGAYTTLLRQRLDAVILSGAPPAAPALGTATQPQLTIVDSDWSISGATEGFGILVVHGSVEIDAELRYGGLVVVTGGLHVAESGAVVVDGALWLGGSGAVEIDLLGAGSIRYAPGNLQRAAAALAGALLHRAEVAAWREVS